MVEWTKIYCKKCKWEGTEEIFVYGKSACPDCGDSDLRYKSDDAPIPIEVRGEGDF